MSDQETGSNRMLVWHAGRRDQVEKQDIRKRRVFSDGRRPVISLFLMLIAISHSTFAVLVSPPRSFPYSQSLPKRATNESSLLECLQVASPVFSPTSDCQQTLMVHTFAFSYGQPFVSDYTPPNCDFNRVTINLTVTSAGRQFDRLALMYLDDIEVFRTSTAEPTRSGIIWNYIKDMSPYLSLFKDTHKIIFDLGNLVDDTYTGTWNTTLTASFFMANDTFEPADIIVPISAQRSASNESSAFTVPDSKAISTLKLPRNTKKAVFSISACGQAAEEFWWSNVLSSDTHVFGNETTLYGHSPLRELQLLIDGRMAGVSWPFPVIFTGGIVPGFWRPIVGIDAFYLREDEIDISPFLPLLNNDNLHTFEIQVVGLNDDGKGNANFTEGIESNWVVTGKIFIWLDSDTSIVAGTVPNTRTPEPSLLLSSTQHQGYNVTIQSLEYSIQVSRYIYIESVLYTSAGPKAVTWQQNLTFSNSGTLSNKGNDQTLRQSTSGTQSSFSGYKKVFEYPLWVISSYDVHPGGNITIDGKMGRGKYVQQIDDLAFANEWKTFDYSRHPLRPSGFSFDGTNTNNWQNGTASYLSVPAQKRTYGAGITEQLFALTGINEKPIAVVQDATNGAVAARRANTKLYQRHVVAANDSIVYDDESLDSQQAGCNRVVFPSQWATKERMHEFAGGRMRALLEDGPY